MKVFFYVIAFFIFLYSSGTIAHPQYVSWKVYESIQNTKCTLNNDDLCQRCAKFTKSASVYPMCCKNLDEARTWCKKAMDFGY